MLTRWRPSVFFWGTAMITRNLFVAFGGIISNEPRAQLLYICCIVIVYFTFTATYQPWRAPMLNHFDVITCLVLCIIGMLGIVLVSLQDEIRTCGETGQDCAPRERLLDAFEIV